MKNEKIAKTSTFFQKHFLLLKFHNKYKNNYFCKLI